MIENHINEIECKVSIEESGVIRLEGKLIGRLIDTSFYSIVEDLLEHREEEND